jgi:hypothetical protein
MARMTTQDMARMALLVAALAAGVVAGAWIGSVRRLPATTVSVIVSSAAPGGNPDLQTRIDFRSGNPFDRIQVRGPAGSSVAQDADLPNGLIVGRLDAEATTNALTRATCDQHVTFTVPITKAPANPVDPLYPAFLRTLAPGKHRLRLVADVSPSPQVPLMLNYLLDIDPTSNGVVMRVFIGDPDHPATQLKTCPPGGSTNTLFGMTPLGVPLLTAPAAVADPHFPLRFEFSRLDAAGVRHTQKVSVESDIRPAAPPPPPPPQQGASF